MLQEALVGLSFQGQRHCPPSLSSSWSLPQSPNRKLTKHPAHFVNFLGTTEVEY